MRRFRSLLVPASAIGSAGLAALATACCVGPVVVALFGVGGAIAAASMMPYRPYAFWMHQLRDSVDAPPLDATVFSKKVQALLENRNGV